jgi:hypothetical protein
MDSMLRILCIIATAALLAACAKDAPKATGKASIKVVRDSVAEASRHRYPPLSFEPLPSGERSIDDVLYSYAPYAVDQLWPYFKKAGVAYPPKDLVLIGLKEEKKLEVWARDRRNGDFRWIRDYSIRAASGVGGPKLRQGDRQVPEGVYRVVRLNPNSNYHLSMKLDYPNAFDLFHANEEGRYEPGSDIFIHGKSVSAGCLAMGDAAIEELFVLAAHVGTPNIKVVIAPRDPRTHPLNPGQPGLPSWTGELYHEISKEILAVSRAEPLKVSSSKPPPPANRRLR